MIKVAHSWPSRVLLEALAPHYVLMYHQGFETVFVFTGRRAFIQHGGHCPAGPISAEPKGISKVLGSGENGRRLTWPCVLFQLTVPGNLEPSQAPGSHKESHLFCSQYRKAKCSLCDISLGEFEIISRNNILYKGTRTREP